MTSCSSDQMVAHVSPVSYLDRLILFIPVVSMGISFGRQLHVFPKYLGHLKC